MWGFFMALVSVLNLAFAMWKIICGLFIDSQNSQIREDWRLALFCFCLMALCAYVARRWLTFAFSRASQTWGNK